jgi:hypothetical protein
LGKAGVETRQGASGRPVLGESFVRVVLLAALMAALIGPAVAGPAYSPPALKPAATLEPPADLRAQAIKLLKAVRAGDVEAVGKFIAPAVTVVSGALDLGFPRRSELLPSGPKASGAVAGLGNHTGGDWDIPPDVDVGKFLADMELDFIEGALTDGQPWGTDPLVPGAICTYGYEQFDAGAVKKLAAKLRIDGSDFVMVPDGAAVLDAPKGRQVGTLAANALYAMDSDADTDGDWVALHLPLGGVGFIAVGEDGLQKPYADGICFEKKGSMWLITGQSSTGL